LTALGFALLTFVVGACFDGIDWAADAARSLAAFALAPLSHTRAGCAWLFHRLASLMDPPDDTTLPAAAPDTPPPIIQPSRLATTLRRKFFAAFHRAAPDEAIPEVDDRWNNGTSASCSGCRCASCFTVFGSAAACFAHACTCTAEAPLAGARRPADSAWAWARGLDWRRELSRPRPLHADVVGPCPGGAMADFVCALGAVLRLLACSPDDVAGWHLIAMFHVMCFTEPHGVVPADRHATLLQRLRDFRDGRWQGLPERANAAEDAEVQRRASQ
jgi:hypothetical protein